MRQSRRPSRLVDAPPLVYWFHFTSPAVNRLNLINHRPSIGLRNLINSRELSTDKIRITLVNDET
jgi:hypothetical protein